MLCGITQPTKGFFDVRGRIAPILALGSAFDGLLTGRENAGIGAAILGLKRREIVRRMDSIAAFADIGSAFEQPMRTYSSGMVARVAFAICAHADADIPIIDEALSVGDEAFPGEMRELYRRLRQERHDLNRLPQSRLSGDAMRPYPLAR
jgi:lipopolysaccharide transport system ATP-binding protein